MQSSFNATMEEANRCRVSFTLIDDMIRVSPKEAISNMLSDGIRKNKELLTERLRLEEYTKNWICNLEYFDAIFNGDYEASTLTCWFWYRAHTLPMEPFELRPCERITDPMKFYRHVATLLADATDLDNRVFRECLEQLKILFENYCHHVMKKVA